ncbi:hypothetical protein H0H92_015419, partial [Tricholoma furcatifolium]
MIIRQIKDHKIKNQKSKNGLAGPDHHMREMDRRHGVERRATQNLTLGYVTIDSCPGIGDDTLHTPLPYYDTPDFIGSVPPN